MEIYKEISELNEAYSIMRKLNMGNYVSKKTKHLSSKYLESLKCDVIEGNNRLWLNFSKHYTKNVLTNKQLKISKDEFDLDKLLKAHERLNIVFNRKCLELSRNEIIVYFKKEDLETVLSELKKATRTERLSHCYDYKDSKNKMTNRSEKGYRKALFKSLLAKKTEEEHRLLVKWFERTDNL